MHLPIVSCPNCGSKTVRVPAKFFIWSSDDVEILCSTCGYTCQCILAGWRNGLRELIVGISASALGMGFFLFVIWWREWLLAFGLTVLINTSWRVALLNRSIHCHAQDLRMPANRES